MCGPVEAVHHWHHCQRERIKRSTDSFPSMETNSKLLTAGTLVQRGTGDGQQLCRGSRHAADGGDGRDAAHKCPRLVPGNVLYVCAGGSRAWQGQKKECVGSQVARLGQRSSRHVEMVCTSGAACHASISASPLTQARQARHAKQAQVAELQADAAPGHQVEHLAQLATAQGERAQ